MKSSTVTLILLTTLLAGIAILALIFFEYNADYFISVIHKSNNATKLAELQAITNSDSQDEVTKEWRGLCKKNSIQTIDDFISLLQEDAVLQSRYSELDKYKLTIKEINEPIKAWVDHRNGSIISSTLKPITIPAHDKYITDGRIRIRLQCCNGYIPYVPETPKTPVTQNPPEVITEFPPKMEMPPITTYLTIGNYPKSPVSTITTTEVRAYKSVTSTEETTPVTPVAPVPEPATMLLFGTGLCILAFKGRKTK